MLSQLGLASRREAEDWIRAGRLTVNGQPATLGMRVAPLTSCGSTVAWSGAHAEPASAACSCAIAPRVSRCCTPDAAAAAPGCAPPRQAMLERLPRRAGRRFISVSPMPRVDGGLELLTADGALARRLQRAVHAWRANSACACAAS